MGPAQTIKATKNVKKPGFVRSDRIAALRELVRPLEPRIDVERARYMTASYKETEGQSLLMRRAKALEKILSEKTIFILDGELVVGNMASGPGWPMLGVEYGAEWILRDLDTFAVRDNERYLSSEEDRSEIRELCEYWVGKTTDARIAEILEPVAEATGMNYMAGAGFMGYGHVTVDFPKMISKGVKGIKEEIEDKTNKLDPWNPDDLHKYQTYKAMNITLDAFVKFAHRYAEFARDMASKEKDPKRQKELEQIAANCEWVPENPARTFWEALQTMWFVMVVISVEGMGYGYQPGRMDQYLYPYYRKDIDEGRLSKEWAQEILEACFCKFQETTIMLPSMQTDGEFIGSSSPAGLQGQPITQNIILGGVTEDGRDASNELSCLILDADGGVRMAQPEVAVRFHKGTPDKFLRHVAEYIKLGTGKPKMFVDETVYRMYDKYARESNLNAKEDMWDYCPAGCIEHHIPGKTVNNEHTAGNLICVPQVILPLSLVLHQGKAMSFGGTQAGPETVDPREIKSFDELMEIYREQALTFGRYNILVRMAEDDAISELTPTPFQSTLMSDCIERGLDATRGGARYNMVQGGNGGHCMGLVNDANGLAAIKKLVFEDKVVSMDTLVNAVDANWEGYEDLRQMVLNRVPKFGNDDDYVDSIMERVLEINGEQSLKYSTTLRKAVVGASISSATGNVVVGQYCGPSLDGRLEGTPVADGGVSPHLGTDKSGPTAILNSVSKLNHAEMPQGTQWNIKFSRGAVEGEIGTTNLINFLRQFIDNGVYHVQINCLDNKELKEAQAHPEDHHNLLVRVAGYSAFFTQMDKGSQDMIIERTEQQVV